MKKNLLIAGASALLTATTLAGPTSLALRLESTSIYHGTTSQTIETGFGTNTAILPFSGTTAYDFYSPPLSAMIGLHANDHASGTVYMANTGTNTTDDFSVTGRMRFFDYDPSTGAETLLADTGDSPAHAIKHSKTANWSLPTVNVLANTTVPVGHQLHINVGIALVSGNPVGIGQFLINGPSGSSTTALLPQDNSVNWNFAPPGVSLPPTTSVSLCRQADGCARLSCSTTASQTYTVQATTSLTSPVWITIGTASADGGGAFSFMDVDAPNYPARFYRLVGP